MFNFGKVNKSALSLDPMAMECVACKCYTWGGTDDEGYDYFDSTRGTRDGSNMTSQPQPWGNSNNNPVK